MSAHQSLRATRVLHWLFEASLAIKGVLCSAEALAGLGLLIAPNPVVVKFVFWLNRYNIAATHQDSLANWTRQALEKFPVGTQHFYGIYLLFHGGLKLTLMVMLWMRILWAYPAGMLVLSGFVAYQVTEFARTGSPFLLLLSVFDLFMIGLIWQEYQALKSKQSAQ